MTQPQTRGFVWAVYQADDRTTVYAKQVDRTSFADPNRGWLDLVAAGAPLWPQRAKPRIVYGVSALSGRRGSTICGSVDAPLWTGAATTFAIETTDGQIDQMTVTRRRGESFAVPR